MNVQIAEPRPPETEGQVCLACGLCCSGAIFDYGPLDADEAHLLADPRFTRWQDTSGFAFPCPVLDGTCCTDYANRPRVCARYRCEVLVGLTAGAHSYERAIELVHRGARLVEAAVAASPHPGRTIGELRRAFQANADGWHEATGTERAALAPLRLALAALERHLDTHFRRPHQRQLTRM